MRRKPYGAIMDDVLSCIEGTEQHAAKMTRLESKRLARILELMDAEEGTPEGIELDKLAQAQMEAERGIIP